MKTILNFIRKPFVWRAIFVVSVLSFNLLLGHSLGTTATWTFFATIFAICIGTAYGKPDTRPRNFIEESAALRRVKYGSSSIYSFPSRKKMRGF